MSTFHHSSAGAPGRPLFGGAGRALASLATAAAAGIHLGQAWQHGSTPASGGLLHGAFFLSVGALQFAVAAALLLERLGPRATRMAAALHAGVALVWVTAVTAGLPPVIGGTGQEPVTVAGIAATVAGLLAAGLLVAARLRRPSPSVSPFGRVRAAAAGAALALFAAGGVLPATAAGSDHTHDSASAGYDHEAGEHSAEAGDSEPHGESGVHIHGLGGDAPDPGPDAERRRREPLPGVRVRAGRQPAAVAAADGVVWVVDREGGTVARFDDVSGRRVGPPVAVGFHPSGIAISSDHVWITNAGDDTVSRLDRGTAAVEATLPVGKVPVGVVATDDAAWVANAAEGTVSRVDATTGAVTTSPRIGFGPTALTLVGDRLWVVASLDRELVSLDPLTFEMLTRTPVGAGASGVAAGHGSLWVVGASDGTVTRVDATTGSVVGRPIVADTVTQPGQGPAAVAVGELVWVVNNHDKTVVAIDPRTGDVSRPRFLARSVAATIGPAGIALTAGAVWATEHETGAAVRLPIPKDNR